MGKIYYKGKEYEKAYGSCYYKKDSRIISSTDCIEVFPDKTVKFLFNGNFHYLGKLVGNNVVEGGNLYGKKL